MLHSIVSCDISNTLKLMRMYEVEKMIVMSMIGIITVTGNGKLQIDGTIGFTNLSEEEVQEKLLMCTQEIYACEKGGVFAVGGLQGMVAPIREYDNYRVFTFCVRPRLRYTLRDLRTLKFIAQVTYKGVLQDNEIIKEKNYLKNIFDSVASFIVSVDLNNIIVSANKHALDRFSENGDPMIGNDYRDYMSDADLGKVSTAVEYAKTKKKTYHFDEEVFINKKKGKLFTSILISPLMGAKGDVTGIVVVGSDKTRQKVYEMEIDQLKQFSMLGELAAGLAHDIKNPLTSIKGCSRILEKKLADNPECMEFLEPIVTEVDRINDVINQMLSYSFITQKDNYSSIDINEVLQKCINVLKFHTKSRQIKVESWLGDDLPLIKADNVQLQQAFVNIMFNAIQAIEHEGYILVESYYISDTNKLTVSISDNGKGIVEEDIPKIFDPLYTTKTSGNGVGLSIVKRAIKNAGGEIIVNSREGIGTEFRVSFSVAGNEEVK